MSQADNVRMMNMEAAIERMRKQLAEIPDLRTSLEEARKDVANLWAKINELRAEMKGRKVA